MKLLFILLFTIFSQVLTAEQWIDPHDMNTNAKKYLKSSYNSDNLDSKGKESDIHPDRVQDEDNSIIYLKRFINLLINSADIDESKPNLYKGKLRFTLDLEGFKFLKDFSNSKTVSRDQLRKLDTILSDMFHVKSYLDDIADVFLSSQEKMVQFLFSKNSLPLLGLSLLIYVAYNLFRSNFSMWYVVRYFIVVVVLIDFVQRYQQLYQEVEEHNMHVEYSTKCDTAKMNWREYLKYVTGNQDCEKKVVSLLEVGLLQIKSVIIIPLSAAGIGMGQFGAGLWNNLPFPWNIVIFPLMLIFCAVLTIIIMSTVNGQPYKFNLMHLLHLEFGEKRNKITNATLDKLLDAVNHRPFLELVKGRDNEKSPPKKKNTQTHTKSVEKQKQSPPKKENLKKSNSASELSSKKAKSTEDTKCVEVVSRSECNLDKSEIESGNPIETS